MSHAIYMTMSHEVIMAIFSHKTYNMLHEKLQNPSKSFNVTNYMLKNDILLHNMLHVTWDVENNNVVIVGSLTHNHFEH
jgi:hypothetical protein